MILGIADNFVVQTRNMEIQFSDIFALGTAATVAGGYKYTLMSSTIFSLFLFVSMILTIAKTKFPRVVGMRRRLFSLLGSFVSCLLVILIVSSSTGLSAIKYIDKYWSFRSSQYNGFYLSLIRSASAAKVDEPHGYSSESLRDLLDDYLNANPTKPVDPDLNPDEPGKKKPNVIVIMNETFSDLQAISEYLKPEDSLQTDVNVLEYYNSLTNEMPNVSKGYLLASVYGGNTANSEFEFLTGNTMAFLPLNTVAYNLYLNENNSDSVVNVMNANGYRTVAMHPAPAKNWSRNYVYQWLGFDQSYFIDDFEDYETYRSETSSGGIPLVTDECVYDKIIEEYENKSEDTPLFTFAVTFQNHGGYSTEGFEPTVNITNSDKYTGAEEYLSCIKKSDEALKEFLEYFQNQEEDTLVVFYGDHQPSLSNSFYSRYFNISGDADTKAMQAKYAVPYMFWGNFEFEDEERELSSINFLAPRMLDIVGVQKTRYLSFVQNLSKTVTAINPYGWWSQNPETLEYEYHVLNMSNISEESPMLQVYYWQQYNLLFDEGNKLEDWFTVPVKKEEELDDTVSP
jgi:phosphoglycerol transferase MdoB-like AlkP superfamily enzyme